VQKENMLSVYKNKKEKHKLLKIKNINVNTMYTSIFKRFTQQVLIHKLTVLINNYKYFLNLKLIFIIIVAVCVSEKTLGQDMAIAQEYLKKSEYSKARDVLEKIIKNKQQPAELHAAYMQCLVQLKEYSDAEKYLKRQIKAQKNSPIFWAELAQINLLDQNPKEAAQNNAKAIQMAINDEILARQLADFYFNTGQTDFCTKTIMQTRLATGNEAFYSRLMAQLLRNADRKEQMIEEMLVFAEYEVNLDYFKAFIQDELKTDKDKVILEKVLYDKVQRFPDRSFYTEALVGHLVNQKQFYKAYLQTRALDKRLKLDGSNVYDLAMTARQNKDHINAAKMFEYLAKEYPSSQEYPYYRRFLIGCREEVIKTTYPINPAEIQALITDYDQLLTELGINLRTIEAIKSKANLQAFYLDQKELALQTLATAVKLGATDRNFVSRCKLDVGDIQLLMGDFWEATLTYQQVDKAEKDSPIGYDAKLRNAKLNYYKGDFEVAEDFLGILDKATTREIANDAMELKLLIRDNTGSDSTEAPMRCYAAADLLLFQNKISQAIDSLSHILNKYKGDGLEDEALFKRANCYLKEGKTEPAVADLQQITQNFAEDVLGDDATFLLAKTTEEQLKDNATAMKFYELLLSKYPGSIYVPESRLRFRTLRGDVLN
jgi:tetratricopeptide (TPR) repeat protein